jgi:membrane protease YdiL (CAAX protease family)
MRLFYVLTAMAALALVGSAPLFLRVLSSLPAHTRLPLPALVALQSLQVMALSALAAYAGVRFAPRTRLDAPWLRAFAERSVRPPGFAGMAIHGVALGSLAAVATVAALLALRSSVPEPLSRQAPLGFWAGVSSALYGGVVEEIMVRWGLLSALLALARKLGARDGFWPANAAAALVFGAAHLPVARAFGASLTAPVVTYVLAANAPAGLLFGWLFRRRGLESAMLAHGAANVWLHAALPALLA